MRRSRREMEIEVEFLTWPKINGLWGGIQLDPIKCAAGQRVPGAKAERRPDPGTTQGTGIRHTSRGEIEDPASGFGSCWILDRPTLHYSHPPRPNSLESLPLSSIVNSLTPLSLRSSSTTSPLRSDLDIIFLPIRQFHSFYRRQHTLLDSLQPQSLLETAITNSSNTSLAICDSKLLDQRSLQSTYDRVHFNNL